MFLGMFTRSQTLKNGPRTQNGLDLQNCSVNKSLVVTFLALAMWGPTLCMSKVEEAAKAESGMWPCSIPRGCAEQPVTFLYHHCHCLLITKSSFQSCLVEVLQFPKSKLKTHPTAQFQPGGIWGLFWNDWIILLLTWNPISSLVFKLSNHLFVPPPVVKCQIFYTNEIFQTKF